MARPDTSGTKLIAQNRRARYDYHIEDTFEAGLQLVGTEVKSCREGKVSLTDAYAGVKDGDAFLYQCHINPYSHGNRENHDPLRPRKLLLHRAEIDKLQIALTRDGHTVVPLRIYFKHGLVKAELAVGRGKKSYDKRADIAKRDADRRMRQAVGRRR